MKKDKSVLSGNTTLLVLSLLDEKDCYGYQIIEELAKRSENVFHLKTGTLYPLLHGLEDEGMVSSYDAVAEGGRTRKYYRITSSGQALLEEKQAEWASYTSAVNRVLSGGEGYAFA